MPSDGGWRHPPVDVLEVLQLAAWLPLGSQRETDKACPVLRLFPLLLIHVGINDTARGNPAHVMSHFRALGAGRKQRIVNSGDGYPS